MSAAAGTIPGLLARTVARHGEAIAVVGGDRRLS